MLLLQNLTVSHEQGPWTWLVPVIILLWVFLGYIFIFLSICLFVCIGLVATRRISLLQSAGFLAVAHRLRSCGRLSCPTVCGIFASQPGIKLFRLWKVGSEPLAHQEFTPQRISGSFCFTSQWVKIHFISANAWRRFRSKRKQLE